MLNNKLFRINVFLILILSCIITYLNKNYTLDDALIYQRYLKNFIDGNGLVYNIGETFNGLTSPLYIYICILVSSPFREVVISQIVLNGFILASASIMLAVIFYTINEPVVGFISSLILISSKYFYMVFGMESNLFILISLCCIYFYFKKKLYLLSVFSALLILTRGEGIFLLIVLLFLILKENKKEIKLKHFLLFILILSAHFLFNYFYYDNIFPQTLTAKIAQGKSGLWGRFGFLTGANFLFGKAFNNQAFYIIIVLIFALIGFANHYKEKFLLILFTYTILITFFYLALHIPNYHWYYCIHMLTFFILVSYGCYDIFLYFSKKITIHARRYILLFLIFIYPLGTQAQMFILLHKEVPDKEYTAIGEWIKNNTPADSKIAVVEIGHLGWYSERYIIDILGLVNPMNAEFIGQKQFSKWFDYYKPDYILVHDPYWPHEQGIPELVTKGFFIEDKSFYFKGYKLLKSN